MKITKLLFAIVALAFLQQSITTAQEAIGINFFDIANSGLGSSTCWDNGDKTPHVSVSSPATFTRCSTNHVPIDMSVGTGSLVFTTKRPTLGAWSTEFKLDWGHSVNFLRYGTTPLLHLRLKWGAIASGADLRISLTDDQQIKTLYRSYNGTGTTYTNKTATVTLSNYVTPSTTVWQDVYIPMSDFLLDNSQLDLTRISVLKFTGYGTYSSTNTMYVEKIRVVPSVGSQYSDMIKVNQIGYLPNSKKIAIVSYEPGAVASPPTYFQVRNASNGDVVFQHHNLTLKTGGDDHSGDIVYQIDFSMFTTPGRYVIYCPEIGQTSVAFDIRSDVFDEVFRDALRFFYFARSGQAIAEPYAEGHTRPAIYANNSTCVSDYGSGAIRDVCGGWFDAGDLHMDVHNNVATLWLMLQTFEQFQNKLGPKVLNLPESSSSTNDIIPLIKWGLDWMKKMQNADGSVNFIVYANSSPVDHQHVSDVSTGSACIAAGIFAKAYTQFATVPGMETYAADLLTRAELSWTWLMAHPTNSNPTSPGIGTWSYSINNDTSFRSFAAIELYIATGTTSYRTFFETAFNNGGGDPIYAYPGDFTGPGASGSSGHYNHIAMIGGINGITGGYYDYATTTRPVNETIKTAIKNAFIADADTLVNRANNGSGTYRLPMLMGNDLFWGSSGLLCGNAYTLLRVYEWTGNTTYRDTAIDSLDWVCGRNTVNRIFITGDYTDYLHGTDHYSFYMFDHLNPVPGYLCGNINMLSGYVLQPYIKYSWKYYLNMQTADFLEPCLPWQAELCYLLGYFATDLKFQGDLNFDGTVNYLDLYRFCQAWLSARGDGNWNAYCDIASPANNFIDFADFAVFAGNWMTSGTGY